MSRLWLALAALFALAGCDARTPAVTVQEAAPALWEITGPQGERGWLFGTIHALPDGVEWETPIVRQALGDADLLVVEVGNLDDPRAAARIFSELSRTPGLPPLLDRLPADQRPVLAAALARSGSDEDDFRGVESWAAALMLANGERTGDVANGVDRALLARGLPIVELEGFARQFSLFDNLAVQDQVDLLYLASTESDAGMEQRLTQAWIKGDLATLEREAEHGILADAELRQALLIDRNKAWMERIVPLLQQNRRPFVAVGAGHMLGDVGLPAVLAAEGYTVRRIQ